MMNIEQLYTKCLAQGAYYIVSGKEAAIIDPLREVGQYIEMAERDGVTIKYIFETHFHADFVSGHVTLAEKTGATIVYGPTAETSFNAHIAEDGEIFKIGDLSLVALHTPGHTMESTSYLLKNEQGEDQAIFSGDTLFLGDVGRPDLAQKAASMTQEELAGLLYESLRSKIMPLSDDLLVYPAHGAGSACGKNMMKETVDTLGNQKKVNYALRADMTKAEFVKEVTDGLAPPPGYFPLNVALNKSGYASIDDVIEKGSKKLNKSEVDKLRSEQKALVLDVRSVAEFTSEHIPNSIFIGLDGSFAPWVGEIIIDVSQSIILVVSEARLEEAITRLARVGFDQTLGFVSNLSEWKNVGEIATVNSKDATILVDKNESESVVIDVRKCAEFSSSHIEGAVHISLSELTGRLDEVPKDKLLYVHCAGGYRSVIAASILKSNGIHNFIDIKGGFGAIKKTTLPLT